MERGRGSGFGSGRKASLSCMQKTGVVAAGVARLGPWGADADVRELAEGPRAVPRVDGECHTGALHVGVCVPSCKMLEQ